MIFCDHGLLVKKGHGLSHANPEYLRMVLNDATSLFQERKCYDSKVVPFKDHLCHFYPVFRNIPIYPTRYLMDLIIVELCNQDSRLLCPGHQKKMVHINIGKYGHPWIHDHIMRNLIILNLPVILKYQQPFPIKPSTI